MRLRSDLLEVASPDEVQNLAQILNHELALLSPADFARYVSNRELLLEAFEEPPHIELLNNVLLRLIEGRLRKDDGTPFRRLLITMPPRHGKSHFSTYLTPAWYRIKYPKNNVFVVGYGKDFAGEWGRKVRDLTEALPEFGVQIRKDSRAVEQWSIARGGEFRAVGMGGAITGKGAHLFVIDDPIKNSEEALSETTREAHWNWYITTARTRLEPGGCMLLIQTRWHEDDLAGRLLEQEPDEWLHIDIPALAGPEDMLGRAEGEALWPERYDAEELRSQQRLDPTWFEALYQQRPFLEGGNIFRKENFEYYTVQKEPSRSVYVLGDGRRIPTFRREWRFLTVDLAASTKNWADYTVIQVWDVVKEVDSPDFELILRDQQRLKVEGADHERLITAAYNRYKPRYVGIERATYGLTLLQTLRRRGMPVQELKPDRDKVSRAMSAAAYAAAGRVHLPKHAEWLPEFEHELLAFPNGKHDDQVDAFAYAVLELVNREHRPQVPKKESSREEKMIRRLIKRKKSQGARQVGSW